MNIKRKQNAKNLIDDTLESYYWIGFLMADGYVGVKNNIRFTLSIKDEQQLINLKYFLGIDNKLSYVKCEDVTKYVTFSINDIETCNILRKKYNITNNKTLNPPDITPLLEDKNVFVSFFIGLFDGDGCVYSKKNIPSVLKIECHHSWHNNLKQIQNCLSNYFGIHSTLKITKRGYSKLSICRYKDFVTLKNAIIEINIPAMCRKWDKIDIHREYRGKFGKEPKEKRLKISYFDKIHYLNETKSVKEWSEIFGISVDTARMRLSRGWSVEKTYTPKNI